MKAHLFNSFNEGQRLNLKYFLSLFYVTVTKKLSGTQFRILQTVLAGDQDISLKSLPKHHFGGTWEASAISTTDISQLTISSEHTDYRNFGNCIRIECKCYYHSRTAAAWKHFLEQNTLMFVAKHFDFCCKKMFVAGEALHRVHH